MTSATKITLAYLLAAIVWLFGVDGFLSTMFPAASATVGLFKCCGFLFLTSLLIHFLLLREGARRDAVETVLRAQAVRDSLTGLLNRASFMEHLEKAIARAARDGQYVGVAFIDLDGFKEINDRFGHQAGDRVLIEISRRIGLVVRQSDVLARLGGDEFVVLAQDEQDNGLYRLGERLSAALREPIVVGAEIVAVTASVGLALYPDHALQAGQLLHAADLAMYGVKATGKNGILDAASGGSPWRPAAA